jgi:hypothetical protein
LEIEWNGHTQGVAPGRPWAMHSEIGRFGEVAPYSGKFYFDSFLFWSGKILADIIFQFEKLLTK